MLKAIHNTLFNTLPLNNLANNVKEDKHVFVQGGIPFAIAFSIFLFFIVSMSVNVIKWLIDPYCVRNA